MIISGATEMFATAGYGTKRTKRAGRRSPLSGEDRKSSAYVQTDANDHSGLAARRNSPNGIYEFRSFDRGLFIISRIKPVYKSASLKLIDER